MKKSIGEILKELRESKELLMREVAAAIHIDQAHYSRIESGERLPTREQVIKLAKFFKSDKNEFIVAWLSDKLVYEVGDEELGLQAMQLAEKKIKYSLQTTNNRQNV